MKITKAIIVVDRLPAHHSQCPFFTPNAVPSSGKCLLTGRRFVWGMVWPETDPLCPLVARPSGTAHAAKNFNNAKEA